MLADIPEHVGFQADDAGFATGAEDGRLGGGGESVVPSLQGGEGDVAGGDGEVPDVGAQFGGEVGEGVEECGGGGHVGLIG